ncbi:MAG: FMN-binding protein [Gammaproteobacteria bacterium]
MTRIRHVGLITGTALLATLSAQAESVYQEPGDFIAASFGEHQPEQKTLWITDEIRKDAEGLTGRKLKKFRVRYWQHENRYAWVLDSIGKDLPITTGVVIESGAIRDIKVLVFRESRGWEVRYPFFTDQFGGAGLNEKRQLDARIDNISGATLSVNALKHQARLALLLTSYTVNNP